VYGDIYRNTVKSPNSLQCNFCVGLVVWICWAFNHTCDSSSILRAGVRLWFAPFSSITSHCLISTWWWWWICSMAAWTWSASRCYWFHSIVGISAYDIWGYTPWMAKKGVHFVESDIPVFAANSAKGSHCTQSSCQWLKNTHRYCSKLAFAISVWLSIWGWNAVDIWSVDPQTGTYLSLTGWNKLVSLV
jgi:hypothetical protein